MYAWERCLTHSDPQIHLLWPHGVSDGGLRARGSASLALLCIAAFCGYSSGLPWHLTAPIMAATLALLVLLVLPALWVVEAASGGSSAASSARAKGPPGSHWTAVNPCLNQSMPFAKQKWCDDTLAIGARVEDMIGRMTLAEKIGSLASSKNPVPSLGLPSYNWRSEANNGVDYYSSAPPTPHSTKFAWPTTTAMAFNRSLFAAIGAQVGLGIGRVVAYCTCFSSTPCRIC